MAKKKLISVGLDIGTYQVKVVVAEENEDGGLPRVLGVGLSESRGLRQGFVINQTEAIQSIRKAMRQAEKTSNHKIREVFVSLGGLGLGSAITTSEVVVSRSDLEITDLDLQKAEEECQKIIPQTQILNRKIIHTIPLQHKIDGKLVYGNPVGMKGARIEVKNLFITYLEHHYNEILNVIFQTGVEVIGFMASPIAASLVTLSKTERKAGCVLANIGSETVSIVVYENSKPVSLEVLPIGSSNITNDIALGFCISLDDAEKVKRGSDIPGISGTKQVTTYKKKLEEIVAARLSEIFELVDAHLKKIGRSGLLPAGIIITGGGSGVINIEDLARGILRLPSKISSYVSFDGTKESDIKIKDATWSVAYGLCMYGLTSENTEIMGTESFTRPLLKKILSWFKQFFP